VSTISITRATHYNIACVPLRCFVHAAKNFDRLQSVVWDIRTLRLVADRVLTFLIGPPSQPHLPPLLQNSNITSSPLRGQVHVLLLHHRRLILTGTTLIRSDQIMLHAKIRPLLSSHSTAPLIPTLTNRIGTPTVSTILPVRSTRLIQHHGLLDSLESIM
jgi:hypothetical protein